MCSVQHGSAGQNLWRQLRAGSVLGEGQHLGMRLAAWRRPHGQPRDGQQREALHLQRAQNVKPAEAEAGGGAGDFRISLPPL